MNTQIYLITTMLLATIAIASPVQVNLTANQTDIFNGQQIHFSNLTTGGQAPYTYRYEVNTSSSYPCKVVMRNNTGTFHGGHTNSYCLIRLMAKDGTGKRGYSSWMQIGIAHVYPLYIEAFYANQSNITVGQSVYFVNFTQGGDNFNHYFYRYNPKYGVIQKGNYFTFTKPGNYSVDLGVADDKMSIWSGYPYTIKVNK